MSLGGASYAKNHGSQATASYSSSYEENGILKRISAAGNLGKTAKDTFLSISKPYINQFNSIQIEFRPALFVPSIYFRNNNSRVDFQTTCNLHQ